MEFYLPISLFIVGYMYTYVFNARNGAHTPHTNLQNTVW